MSSYDDQRVTEGRDGPLAEPYQMLHLNLPVTNIEVSLDFYVRKLGFTYLRHLHERKVILEFEGFDFFIEECPMSLEHPRFHFGISTSVKGVYDFAALLDARGIEQVAGPQSAGRAEIFVTPDDLRHVLYFVDPDDNMIEVYSHIGVDMGYVDEAYVNSDKPVQSAAAR